MLRGNQSSLLSSFFLSCGERYGDKKNSTEKTLKTEFFEEFLVSYHEIPVYNRREARHARGGCASVSMPDFKNRIMDHLNGKWT